MPNRVLTRRELDDLFRPLFTDVVAKLDELSGSDEGLLFALRRKLYKELTYLERSKPVNRNRLKAKKRKSQHGRCALCNDELPVRGAVLDRLQAMGGYTTENTRLICLKCDENVQSQRGYK